MTDACIMCIYHYYDEYNGECYCGAEKCWKEAIHER